jgi:hypothetical protein
MIRRGRAGGTRRAVVAGLVVALAALSAAAVAGAGDRTGGELPEPQADPEEVRRTADEILARSEFDEAEPSVWDEVTEWIGERFADLFSNSAEAAGGNPVFGYVVIAAALAGLGYLLYRWLRGFERDVAADEPVDVLDDAHFVSADWRAAAERCESDGQWKEALRCRYRVLVSELVERQVVGDAPGRTAGEYRAEVAGSIPAAAPPFGEATDLFELAWYADEPTGPDENREIRTLTDRVVEAVR